MGLIVVIMYDTVNGVVFVKCPHRLQLSCSQDILMADFLMYFILCCEAVSISVKKVKYYNVV